ncbi:MAG: MGMT family protein [Spirochaetales bacterium]|uniref:MGMT family protein n=1 Tax=Candidatus Thalassospirochaeta sargassi TaxID=3119039 RepID=A0AAJ1ICA9_9SPIO|nr:MGMT family protein [Spirochaetales bacterium]
MTEFSKRVINLIASIPEGRVASYGRIAGIAGNPRAARQVSRLLHSSGKKYNLPWHRVLSSTGTILLKGEHAIIQRGLLESEGIEFDSNGSVDMDIYEI